MAQTHALHAPRFRIAKLDFTRISAEAGAFAINGAALLLLLAPLSMHVPLREEAMPPTIYEVHPRKLPENPPPIPPKRVEITPPRTNPVAPTLPQKIELPQQPVFDEALPGDLPAEPEVVAKVEFGRGNDIAKPLAGAHLEYLEAPAPRYPIEAIRESLSGTVTLRVLVDVDGKPIDVQVEQSSGHRMLDLAAKRQVLAKWRFKPAMEGGRAVQAIGLVPVVFNLNR
ncbi:energy transducer TonB [Lysobacter yangpyeongensis]|uniref:Energy transducer TonB n=1 Tax=Lysobacter yangpyeongensis TaxID=346182 RepID=A0ABW0SHQ8_9GAMM